MSPSCNARASRLQQKDRLTPQAGTVLVAMVQVGSHLPHLNIAVVLNIRVLRCTTVPIPKRIHSCNGSVRLLCALLAA